MIIKTNKDIESKIRDYYNYDLLMNNLQIALEKKSMEGSPKDITAVDLTSVGGGSGHSSAERIFKDIENIKYKIQKLNYDCKLIDSIINIIKKENEIEYKFIIEYYKNNKDIMSVATDLGYSYNSRNSVYKIRENILKKFNSLNI